MDDGRRRPVGRGMAAMLIAGQCTRHGVWRSRRPAAGGDPAPAGGMVHAGCTPHFLFGLGRKENGPCTVQKKRPLRRASVQWPSARRGSAYRCKRRFGLAFGHATIFCEFATAVPWRMVPTLSGWSSHGTASLLPARGYAASVSGKAVNGCAVAAAGWAETGRLVERGKSAWDAGLSNTAGDWGVWSCWR